VCEGWEDAFLPLCSWGQLWEAAGAEGEDVARWMTYSNADLGLI
jgi:hypothetical protein